MSTYLLRNLAGLAISSLAVATATAGDAQPAETTTPAPVAPVTVAPAPAPAIPAPTAPVPAPAAATDAEVPPPEVKPFDTGKVTAFRTGTVELSNGEKLKGRLALTEGRTVRLFEIKTNSYTDVTFDKVQKIEVKVEYEKTQEEWAFKEGGNDEKILTGKHYIDRRYQVRFTLLDGKTATGYVLGTVFYLTDEKNTKHRYFLHKDERGDVGQEAKDLIYVSVVTFDAPPPSTPAATATPPATPPARTGESAPSATPLPSPAPQQQEPKK